MTIADFEIWQQSECRRLGITAEEHNRILEILNKMSPSGWRNYDVFINATNFCSVSLKSFSCTIQGVNNERKES